MSATTKYVNPFISERADPYIIKAADGFYFFTASYPMKCDNDPEGYDRIILRRSKTLEGLAEAEEKTIWKADSCTSSHRFIWAPELHYIGGRWYVLYSGSVNSNNRWAIDCHVLQCQSEDPYTGEWIEKGKFQPAEGDDFSYTGFSLDMTYFECSEHSYVIWAQHSPEKTSCLYIGEVNPQEPWKLITKPMLLTEPEYDWEKVRFPVNEGPSVLQHDGKVFVCFSASGTGPEYCVGLLEADAASNLLDITSWKKYDKPLLTSEDVPGEYGPGHNSFTVDEYGNDVFVYHARSEECFQGKCGYSGKDPLYDPCRHARLRTVIWSKVGTPILNGISDM